MIFTQLNNAPRKNYKLLIFFRKVPVYPGNFVILTICIVISVLRTAEFIAGKHHRNTLRKQKAQDIILYFLKAELFYLRINGNSFKTMVITVIVISSVAVVFTVFVVVLSVKAD